MTQEQSVLTKIMTVFAAEEVMLQHNVFPKVAIEVDEQGHNDRL